MNPNIISIGIDISKTQLDVFILNASQKVPQKAYRNSQKGILSLLKDLKSLTNIHRIVIEPTGGYERELLHACVSEGLPVSCVHAKRIRDFAKATGLHEKTDSLDSRVLAQYGALLSPALTQVPSKAERTLAAYVLRRRQIIDMITAEKNRLEKAGISEIKRSIEKTIKALEKILKETEGKIETLLQSEPLEEKVRVLRDVKGVGKILAATLLGQLPELGALDKGKIAKLVGVAPIARKSGSWQGQRHIYGGRHFVRKNLYMATIVAMTHNETIREYYQRLLKRGKKAKVAIVAAMRKLLLILNARMRNFRLGEKVF